VWRQNSYAKTHRSPLPSTQSAAYEDFRLDENGMRSARRNMAVSAAVCKSHGCEISVTAGRCTIKASRTETASSPPPTSLSFAGERCRCEVLELCVVLRVAAATAFEHRDRGLVLLRRPPNVRSVSGDTRDRSGSGFGGWGGLHVYLHLIGHVDLDFVRQIHFHLIGDFHAWGVRAGG
jgi:hypothetical protein